MKNTLEMELVNILRKKISLIITPIDNIDFESKEVIDNELIEEFEVGVGTDIKVFNLKTQGLEVINVNSIKEGDHHWYIRDGKLFKIIHLI